MWFSVRLISNINTLRLKLIDKEFSSASERREKMAKQKSDVDENLNVRKDETMNRM